MSRTFYYNGKIEFSTEEEAKAWQDRREVIKKLRHVLSSWDFGTHLSTEELNEILTKLKGEE